VILIIRKELLNPRWGRYGTQDGEG